MKQKLYLVAKEIVYYLYIQVYTYIYIYIPCDIQVVILPPRGPSGQRIQDKVSDCAQLSGRQNDSCFLQYSS